MHTRPAFIGRWIALCAAMLLSTQTVASAQTATSTREALAAQQAAAALAAQHPVNPSASDTQHVIGATSYETQNGKNGAVPGAVAGGTRILSEADLPHIRYPLHESASSLAAGGDAEFTSFLSHYAPDLTTLLAGFSIENKPMLLRLLETQEDAAILSGDRKAAEAALNKQKDLETSQPDEVLLGLSDVALLRAWKKTGADDGEAFEKAYADEYSHRINSLAWAKFEESVKAMTAQCAGSQPEAQLEYVKQYIDPATAATHAVTLANADRIVLARKAVQFDQRTRTQRCAILTAYVSSHEGH